MFWLCFATGCRFGSLCSQARSAGRNLITLFFTVNNPREKISRRCPSTCLGKTLCKRPAPPPRRSTITCARTPGSGNVERKTLKRSTFASDTAGNGEWASPTTARSEGLAAASRTAAKRRRNLFTSANAFCVRICRTAQTFGRLSAPIGCRLHASLPRIEGGRHAFVWCRLTAQPSRMDNALHRGNRSPPRAGKKKRPPKAVVFSRRGTISVRRRPALQRSRPDPAGRSTLPCWTVRPRRSSRRRRRLR